MKKDYSRKEIKIDENIMLWDDENKCYVIFSKEVLEQLNDKINEPIIKNKADVIEHRTLHTYIYTPFIDEYINSIKKINELDNEIKKLKDEIKKINKKI